MNKANEQQTKKQQHTHDTNSNNNASLERNDIIVWLTETRTPTWALM